MRRLFDRLQADLSDFIEQRNDLAMIVSATDEDAGLTLALLDEIEQANGTDIFFIFSDPFTEPGAFVSVMMERLREQHRMLCDGLAEKGREAARPLPSALFDPYRTPESRMGEAIVFTRSLLPRDGDHRLVWAVVPNSILDRSAYLRFVSVFVPSKGIKPWMSGVRLIFRDLPNTRVVSPGLSSTPRTRVVDIDFGPAAMSASLARQAEDPAVPQEEQRQSLLMTALLDYAHGRPAEAIGKYTQLLSHYQQSENHGMQAFLMNAMGDVFHRAGDLPGALHWYECAVLPASAAKDPNILASITKNLGDVAYKQERYSDAEQYFDGLDKLTSVTLDSGTKISALEWRGLAQEQQGKLQNALNSLQAATQLAETFAVSGVIDHLEGECARVRNKCGAYPGAASVFSKSAGVRG